MPVSGGIRPEMSGTYREGDRRGPNLWRGSAGNVRRGRSSRANTASDAKRFNSSGLARNADVRNESLNEHGSSI